MLESDNSSSPPDFSLYCLGFESESQQSFSQLLDSEGVQANFLDSFENTPTDGILLLRSTESSKKLDSKLLEKIKSSSTAHTLLLFSEDLTVASLSELLSVGEVFSVLEAKGNLMPLYKKAVEAHKDQKKYVDSLKKVKQQNRALEELKENLESLVHERTKKEFVASQQIESSVKEIQSILNFIKNVSRLESVDDLLNQIRAEFKKIHGLMPPLLLVEDESIGLHCYYFQGKQLIEKNIQQSSVANFSKLSEAETRHQLSNMLGRPFSSLSQFDIQFRSQELSGVIGTLVFEHSLSDKKMEDYQGYSKQRWPIINMALESILLKEGLQDIAKQWAKTFNEMTDPIVILDSNYKVSLSNKSFDSHDILTGFSSLKDHFKSLKESPIEKSLVSYSPQVSDIRLGEKLFRVHSYPIKMDGYDQASHVINQYVDITLTTDLRSRVIQGEKMAAVGLLAGNIAHELNNPLTGIHSLSELLLDDLEKETSVYKDLTEVKNAAIRCQRIIKDLLEFSDIGDDSSSAIINVNRLVEKTLPLLKMAMRTLNSDIELFEEELNVQGNPQLLQQVLFNLINNACQAMDDGGYLYVTTKPAGDFVEISVRDTGTGIPQEIRDSVFDPFFTTKTEGNGTGLGLSMSKSVVERFGGELKLNTELEKGTEFIICLPLIKK